MDTRKERYKTDPEFRDRRLRENARWRKRNREKDRQIQANYFKKNKEKIYKRAKEWFKKNPGISSIYGKRGRNKYKTAVFEHYGQKCKCCGVDMIEFLCIDHINGDGNKHRASISKTGSKVGGSAMYSWLVLNNFPDGFQTLCFNCNMAKHIYGVCPHQKIQNTEL